MRATRAGGGFGARGGFGPTAGPLIGTAWLLVMFAGCRTPPPASAVMPAAATAGRSPAAPATHVPVPPATEPGCRACDGIWGRQGIATVESCNCRTHDGGARCRDGGECQGACVAADEPERDIVSPGPPPLGYFVGRCSDLMTVFGCSRFIDRGAASRGPASLAESPPLLCVD